MEASLSWQHTWGGFYTLTANGEYSQSFGKMPYLGERVSLGHPSFFIDTNHRFTLGKGLSATVSGRYETKNYFFPQETDALYRVNLSLSYYVKDWILSLSGSNLIVNDTGATSKYAYLQRRFCIDSFRGVSFSVAYRFNKYTERYKRNDANDEMYYRGIRR